MSVSIKKRLDSMGIAAGCHFLSINMFYFSLVLQLKHKFWYLWFTVTQINMVCRIVLLVAFIGMTSAVKIDMCRTKPPVMKDFNLAKLEGKWYEYARLPNIFQYLNREKCGAVDMAAERNGMKLDVYFINETSGKEVHLNGKMSTNPDKPGKVIVELPIMGKEYFSVVDAKYGDYVVFYYCDTLWYFKVELSWILTREAVLSDVKKQRLIKTLQSLKIDTKRLEFENQTNC